METYNLAHRGGLQTGGIVVTQVLLCRKREFDDVVDGSDVVRGKVHLLHLMTVERDVVVHIVHHLVQALALKLAHLLTRHSFLIGVPDHV